MKIIAEHAIPTSCASNHASNLLELPNGDILCTWFGGSMEGSADISICLARFDASAGRWTQVQKISDDVTRSEQNPVLFYHPSGKIWLLWTAQLGADQGTSIIRLSSSTDNGESWNQPEELIQTPGTFIRQRPIIHASGRIILPAWRSNIHNAFGDDHSIILISDDHGTTWQVRDIEGSRGCVHMNIVDQGRIAFFRRRQSDHIFSSLSDDGGLNWSTPKPTPLPNNNASIQGCGLKDGRILMAYNHIAASGKSTESNVPPWIEDHADFLSKCNISDPFLAAIWGIPRNPLRLASSLDLGESWQQELILEDDANLCAENDETGAFRGDYSYPSVIQTSNGLIQVSYSYLRTYIKHVMIES